MTPYLNLENIEDHNRRRHVTEGRTSKTQFTEIYLRHWFRFSIEEDLCLHNSLV